MSGRFEIQRGRDIDPFNISLNRQGIEWVLGATILLILIAGVVTVVVS